MTGLLRGIMPRTPWLARGLVAGSFPATGRQSLLSRVPLVKGWQQRPFSASGVRTLLTPRPSLAAKYSTAPGPSPQAPKWTAYWLFGSAGLVFGIVVLGGLTRLTESGLSITEWRPITGVVPPLTAAQWEAEFSKYKDSPEFRVLNSDMNVEEFKFIFLMEWAHRLGGRAIGIGFLLPTIWLVGRGRIAPVLRRRLLTVCGLIGAQGFIGWWMVKSGISDDELASRGGDIPRVSQYRLAAHLGIAFTIYVKMVWAGLDVLASHRPPVAIASGLRPVALASRSLFALIFFTAMSGAFVAGLDAGLVYNEFPSMGPNGFKPSNSELFAPEYSRAPDRSDLIWRNLLENPVTVQFVHRVLAVTTFTATTGCVAWALATRRALLTGPMRRALIAMAGLVTLQAGLGISTLIYMVPVPLAAAHQAGSLALLTGACVLCKRMSPARLVAKSVKSSINIGGPSPPLTARAFSTSAVPNRCAIGQQCRALHSSARLRHGDYPDFVPGEGVNVTFVAPNGESVTIEAPEGVSILDVAHANDIDIEGACEGSCACSTCHVIVDDEHYDELPEPSDEENDMLDLAFGLEETSRLGCQVMLTAAQDGMVVRLPSATRNMRVDGSKPTHH